MWENLSEIFNWVTRGSLYATAVVLVVFLVQTLTRRTLPAGWRYALWLILLARLVMPALPETNWNLWNLASPERWARLTAPDFAGRDAVNTAIPQAPEIFGGGHVEFLESGGNRISQSIGGFFTPVIRKTLSVVWLAGVLVMFTAAAFVNLRLWNAVRGLDCATDSKLLELFADCKHRMRVKTMTGLVVTDRVENPFLFGFIRPRVLLPAELARRISTEQLRCVLLHELAHLKRGDIVIGWLAALLQSLHWFNPVIWWAFSRMRSDREAACDSLVLSRMSDETRCHYGSALIGVMEHFNRPRHQPAIVAGIIENKDQLKGRLVMITKFRYPARRESITAAALLAVLSIALLTEPPTLRSQSSVEIDDPPEVKELSNAMRKLVESAKLKNGVPLGVTSWRRSDDDHMYDTYLLINNDRLDLDVDTS